ERALFTMLQSANRIESYDIVARMIAQRPLTGFGYDAFPAAFQLYRDQGLASQSYFDMAHNTYLTLWVEQGLLVGSVPVLLLVWAFIRIIGRLRNGGGDPAVLAGALGVMCVAAVHSLADFSLEIPANVYCFLFIVGLAIAPPRNVVPATPAGTVT
ncbi:MAG: O-antigen ligase family protein, partial [Oceanicaulis sp.]|nr:O-antigen ligase family protein [Oceanicaulis sp.]